MRAWEYCYVLDSLQPADGEAVRNYFIARPDRAENHKNMAENVLLEILGSEGWELVSVVPVQTSYAENRANMGAGQLHPSAVRGSSNTSATVYYFKRPVEA